MSYYKLCSAGDKIRLSRSSVCENALAASRFRCNYIIYQLPDLDIRSYSQISSLGTSTVFLRVYEYQNIT